MSAVPLRLLDLTPFISLPLFAMQIGFFDEKVGPLSVAIVVMISLTLILASAIKDVVSSR